MDQRIQEILQDLYQIDIAFKAHEKELRTLIQDLLLSKPNAKVDATFAAQLRSQLLQSMPASVSQSSPYWNFFSSFGKFQYAIAGGLVVLLFVVPLTYYSAKNQKTQVQFAVAPHITQVGNQNFGSINATSNVTNQSTSNSTSFGKGGAGIQPLSATGATTDTNQNTTSALHSESLIAPMASGMGGGATGNVSTKMMMYPPEVITYTYAGEPFTVPESGNVYKRVTDTAAQEQLSALLRSVNFGVIAPSSFGDMKVQNITLAEDKPFGYSLNVDFMQSTISINPNWQFWQNGSTAEVAQPMPMSQMPADETLIATADAFLKQHSIDISSYGKPMVVKNQYILYEAAGTAVNYAPEMVNIVYPLQLADSTVYENGGTAYGLQINLDVRNNRVSGVYNITSQQYQASSYSLETDMQKIVTMATSQNSYYSGYPENVKKTTLSLGTPTQVLMHYYRSNNQGIGEELFVPALVFPVQNSSTQQTIMVPLVKEFIQDSERGVTPPIPMSAPASSGIMK